MAGWFFENADASTPEAFDRKRALINALAKENLSAAPVGHWTQALSRVLGAAADGYQTAEMNAQEKKAVDENKAALMAAFGLGGASSPAANAGAALPAPQPAPAPVPRETMPMAAEDGTPLPPVRPASLGGQATGIPPQFGGLGSTSMAFAPAASPPASLIASESGGNWQAQNNAMGAGGKPGHFGRLQFGQARLQDAINAGALPPGTTPQAFMASPELQRRAEQWHFADIDRAIASGPAAAAIGRAINGVPVTQDGLRAVAHLGGVGGMNKFVQSGGAYNPADANGTTLMAYLARHGGGGQAPTAAGSQSPAAAPVAPAGGGMASPQAQALLAALSSPWAAKNPMLAQLGAKMLGDQMAGRQTTPVDLGNQIALLDKSGNVVRYLPKAKDATQEALAQEQLAKAKRENTMPKTTTIKTSSGEEITVEVQPDGSFRLPQVQGVQTQQQPVNIPGVGQVVPPQDKKAREAFNKEVGERQAKAVLDAPQAIENANGALSVLEKLDKHPGLPRILGWNSKFPSAPGSGAADAEAMLAQVKGKTFLAAFESLKGAGQITEVEGQKASEAIARLNQNQSEKAFRESIAELRGIIQRGLARAKAAGQVPNAPAAAPAGVGEPVTINGFTIQRIQ